MFLLSLEKELFPSSVVENRRAAGRRVPLFKERTLSPNGVRGAKEEGRGCPEVTGTQED